MAVIEIFMSHCRFGLKKHTQTIELCVAISALPYWVSVLELDYYSLGQRHVNSIIKIISSIPATVMSLSLSNNELNVRHAAELVRVFTAIPHSVTELDLTGNNLSSYTATDLIQIIAAIPAVVTAINLSNNGLYRYTAAELVQIIAAIPMTITTINLSNNQLSRFTVEEQIQIMAAIPVSVTSLNLSNNALAQRPLLPIISAIPASVLSLNLSKNELHLYRDSYLLKLYLALSKNLISLNISDNMLDIVSPKSLFKNLKMLHSGITSIKLGCIDLTLIKNLKATHPGVSSLNLSKLYRPAQVSFIQLVKILKNLPGQITTLILREHWYGSKTVEELAQFIATIPASVTSLDLSRSEWEYRTVADLVAILSAIPLSVRSLNLSRIRLGWKTAEEIAVILAAIPKSVILLNLKNTFIYKMDLITILTSLSQVQFIVLDGERILSTNDMLARCLINEISTLFLKGEPQGFLFVLPPFAINELRRQQLIMALKEQNTPIAHFVCGLLFCGAIESTVDIRGVGGEREIMDLATCLTTDVKKHHTYVATCIVESITSFRLAARSAKLKPFAEFMLWHLKTIYDAVPEVRFELASFMVEPSPKVIPFLGDFFLSLEKKEYYLNQLTQQIDDLILKKDFPSFLSIMPVININETRRHDFVLALKQRGNSMSYFIAGLLLSGAIVLQERKRYIFESVELFRLAAEDPELKPFAAFIVDNLPSFQEQGKDFFNQFTLGCNI